MKALKGKKAWTILTALVLILGDLLKVLLITGVILLCKFIDWRERCDQRYPALEQDW